MSRTRVQFSKWTQPNPTHVPGVGFALGEAGAPRGIWGVGVGVVSLRQVADVQVLQNSTHTLAC